MKRARTYRQAGIHKRVCEPFYPNDWLSDEAVQSADLATRGAWFQCLAHMWREDTYRLRRTPEEFAALWRCDVAEVKRICNAMKRHGICRVTQSRNCKVTLTCRRLERRMRKRDMTRRRVRKHRCNAPRNAQVAGENGSPSSSSSFNPPIVPPDGGTVPPLPADETSSAEQQTLNILVSQFKRKAEWIGSPEVLYRHFREALQYFDDGQLSQGIQEHVQPGAKPWDFLEKMQRLRRQHRVTHNKWLCPSCGKKITALIEGKCRDCYYGKGNDA